MSKRSKNVARAEGRSSQAEKAEITTTPEKHAGFISWILTSQNRLDHPKCQQLHVIHPEILQRLSEVRQEFRKRKRSPGKSEKTDRRGAPTMDRLQSTLSLSGRDITRPRNIDQY